MAAERWAGADGPHVNSVSGLSGDALGNGLSGNQGGVLDVKEALDSVSDSSVSPTSPPSFVPGSKDDPHRAYRIGKQCLLALCWIGIGFFNEIIGPTLPDLKDRIGVNYETVSQAMVAKSVGSMCGAIFGGFMHEKYYRHADLIIACGLWLGAISTVVMPFANHLALLGFMFVLSGIAEGVINAGGNTIVMDMWGDKAAGPMSSLHFGFGLGALVAPQLAGPFLSPDAQDLDEDSLTTAGPTTANWNTTMPAPAESRIEIAYGIVSILSLVFGFIVLGVYLKGPPKGFVMRQPSGRWKEMLHPASCGHGHVFFSVELLILLFLYFIQAVGGERAIGKFLFSFAVESDVKFLKKDATSLQTAFWGSFTAGRLLGVPLGRLLPVWSLMIMDCVGVVVVSAVMCVYAATNRLALWITASFMGFFISMAFPNGMSWANIYLDMNNVSVMILIIGGACGGFIYQYLTGYLFERDPHNLPYILAGYAGALVIVVVIMQTLAIVHGRKILREAKKDQLKDEVIVVQSNKEKLALENPVYDFSTHL